MNPEPVYHPKGGMCLGCVWLDADCTKLDFKKMPVIERGIGCVIVRCTNYQSIKKSL